MTGPAVIVGIGPGLGIALVRRFAQGGMPVAFIGRRAGPLAQFEAQLQSEGLTARGFVADAARPETMTAAFAEITAAFGDPEALVYNAAIVEPARFVTPSGVDQVSYGDAPGWRSRGARASFDYLVDAFKANVAGALHAAQLVTPAMLARGEGTLLLTGGVLAFEPWLEWGVTALGKAALRSLGLSLFQELYPAGVRVCTIAIHGTMHPGTPYDPALVADAYWDLHADRSGDWLPDLHFKPEATA